MSRRWCALSVLTFILCLNSLAANAQTMSLESLAHAEVLRERAMAGSHALSIVTSLTTEVGPRLAGSEAEARARAWALNTLTEKRIRECPQ